MREGSPSVTAMFVAFARAVGSREPELREACRDPAAEALSAGVFKTLLRAARRGPEAPAYSLFRLASLGLVDHVALRTAVIDQAVREAVQAGARQLVILGAGLDGRAHRMAELADVVVFEVDHPSTQRLKRRKAEGLARAAREIRYAACDFETVTLDVALAGAQFEPNVPSVWIWEGVTMYLPEAAVVHSLDVVARLSAPGSRLITSYLTPEISEGVRWVGKVGAHGLGTLSEPIRFTASPERMANLLRARHFATTSDVLPSAAAREFGATVSRYAIVLPSERVAVSVREAGSSPGAAGL